MVLNQKPPLTIRREERVENVGGSRKRREICREAPSRRVLSAWRESKEALTLLILSWTQQAVLNSLCVNILGTETAKISKTC